MAKTISITVVGKSPLLTHNPASTGAPKKEGKGSRIPTPEDEAEAGCYRLEDGTLAIPGIGPRNAIIAAAGDYKKARGKGSMRGVLSHIVVLEELIPLKRLDGSPIKDYVIDSRRAVVQRQGIIRSRPRFNEWSATFTVEYDEALISDPQIIVEIANDAGQRIGIGDYRPAKTGWFGRFTALAA